MAINIGFNEQRFLTLLSNLIGETLYLQNNPPDNVPQEDRSVLAIDVRLHVRICRLQGH